MATGTVLTTLSVMNATWQHFSNPNYTYPSSPIFPSEYYENVPTSHNPSGNGTEDRFKYIFFSVFSITLLLTSTFGAVGNGVVIWLLGFCIKKNPFMTYILNLAVADFGIVILVILYEIYCRNRYDLAINMLLRLNNCMYCASQSLLTALSIDRCVAVFFPLWYRCKRPPRLTTIVCALIWVFSVLLTAVDITLLFLNFLNIYDGNRHTYQVTVNIILCLPFMTIAFVSLLIKACLKARQHQREKPLTTVLLTLVFFFLFGFPLNVIFILYLDHYLPEYIVPCVFLLATLNSSVNPVIYFLVGRESKSTQRESMTMILLRVFTEEGDCAEEAPV
ncbi:mas-related G-protein coupled receptor member H-like [Paroedura picta]|uniref:mas-related G-protein coupled receptor member H-like n=1 Tax=Paroedura picta TaxID=143630 RepID=UPI004056F3A0